MNKQEKTAKVEQLTVNVKESSAMLLADFRGITVAQARELRTTMSEAGGKYEVVKNTLMIRAAEAAGADELKGLLEGPTAITFCGEDAVGPAKILVKYAKEFKPLEIKGGILDGRVIDADKIKFLASLPSKEVIMAQMLGIFQSPARGLVTVLAGNMQGLVNVLNKVKEQKEAA